MFEYIQFFLYSHTKNDQTSKATATETSVEATGISAQQMRARLRSHPAQCMTLKLYILKFATFKVRHIFNKQYRIKVVLIYILTHCTLHDASCWSHTIRDSNIVAIPAGSAASAKTSRILWHRIGIAWHPVRPGRPSHASNC